MTVQTAKFPLETNGTQPKNKKERTLLVEDVQKIANTYVKDTFGESYFVDSGHERDHGWSFRIQFQREELSFCPMVGYLAINHDGRVQTLSDEKIRDMMECAEVYVAKEQGEPFARDENGYVLRYHARIKANAWSSNNIAMKAGAEGGMLLELGTPVWRFSVHYYSECQTSPALDIIDVDAATGAVIPVPQERIEIIQEAIGAARRNQKSTAKAVQ